MELTAEVLRAAFDYDPETGLFSRRNGNSRKVGCVAQRTCRTPYLRIGVGGRHYYAHRLAWLWMTGDWPKVDIDHIDRNGFNNRWSNLRDVPRGANMLNGNLRKDNKSGTKGVAFHKNRWMVRISDGYIGRFRTLEEAIAARQKAECAP